MPVVSEKKKEEIVVFFFLGNEIIIIIICCESTVCYVCFLNPILDHQGVNRFCKILRRGPKQ